MVRAMAIAIAHPTQSISLYCLILYASFMVYLFYFQIEDVQDWSEFKSQNLNEVNKLQTDIGYRWPDKKYMHQYDFIESKRLNYHNTMWASEWAAEWNCSCVKYGMEIFDASEIDWTKDRHQPSSSSSSSSSILESAFLALLCFINTQSM